MRFGWNKQFTVTRRLYKFSIKRKVNTHMHGRGKNACDSYIPSTTARSTRVGPVSRSQHIRCPKLVEPVLRVFSPGRSLIGQILFVCGFFLVEGDLCHLIQLIHQLSWRNFYSNFDFKSLVTKPTGSLLNFKLFCAKNQNIDLQ